MARSLFDEMQAGLSGHYVLERELGHGGMSTVFLARDLRLDRRVGLKVLNPELAAIIGPQRFQREIQLTARLTHPHILPLLDSGEVSTSAEAPSRIWYTMPWVNGEALRDRLQREGQLPVADAVRVSVEVAEALDYAHRQGFVHRDIKPENILIQDGHALVADFGIARAIDSGHDHRLTKTGILMGTPSYMSPEQATGSTTLDGRTDLYSLGCVLYELLTGEAPFRGANSAAIVAQLMTQEPPHVGVTRPTAAALEPVLTRALARIPADRYATGREFAAALTQAAPTVQAEPIQKRSTDRRARVILAAALLAVLLTTAWLVRRGVSTSSESEKPRIAVLPLESASELPEDRAFADAFFFQLIAELNSIESIVVMDRRAMSEYQGSTKTNAEVAKELNATYVVDVNLAAADGRVRIIASLYDSAGNHIWTGDPFDRELRDVFALQADVARAITQRIRTVLTPAEGRRLAASGPLDTVAYNRYTLGRWYLERVVRSRVPPDSSPQLLLSAADLFEQAARIDSTFALARVFLASAFNRRASSSVQQQLVDSLYALSEQSAKRALQIDPDEALAWDALAFVYSRTWRFKEAQDAFVQASRLSPNSGHWSLALHYRAIGNLEGARKEFESARMRDPFYPLLQAQYGGHLACMGRFAEAERLLDSTALAPLGFEARTYRARLRLRQQRFTEAIEELEREEPPNGIPLPLLAYAYAKAGDQATARQIVKVREAAGERGWLDDLVLADTKALVSRLKAMAAHRDQRLLIIMRCHEALPDLLAIPEARAILKELPLPNNPAAGR